MTLYNLGASVYTFSKEPTEALSSLEHCKVNAQQWWAQIDHECMHVSSKLFKRKLVILQAQLQAGSY